VTRHVMSSIYFFHDPELRSDGLGTYSVLREIEEGRAHGRQWLYMGLLHSGLRIDELQEPLSSESDPAEIRQRPGNTGLGNSVHFKAALTGIHPQHLD
jgi:hypothetical protein